MSILIGPKEERNGVCFPFLPLDIHISWNVVISHCFNLFKNLKAFTKLFVLNLLVKTHQVKIIFA